MNTVYSLYFLEMPVWSSAKGRLKLEGVKGTETEKKNVEEQWKEIQSAVLGLRQTMLALLFHSSAEL